MTIAGWAQIILYFLVLLLLIKPVGSYMVRVYQGDRTFLSAVIAPFEKLIYRICGIHPEEEMTWTVYAIALMIFSFFGILFLFIL